MSLGSKLKSLGWYVRRPQFLPHLWYQVALKFKSNEEVHRNGATEWCEQVAKPVKNVLKELGLSNRFDKFEELFPDIYEEALNEQNDCPVEMGGQGFLDLLYHIANQFKNPIIVETGVAYGWSSLIFLKSINNKPNTKLISIDLPYLQRNNDDFVGCVVPKHLRSKWILIRSSDRQALPSVLNDLSRLTICHYDSDKTYHGRMWAYPRLWNKLEEGGIFISDDINDNYAFRDFCDKLGKKAKVVKNDGKHIGILRK